MLETKKFIHAPLYVDAVQVTAENMKEVTKWCGGSVISTFVDGSEESVEFIKVPVLRAQRVRQTQAFVGDWVLYTGVGFKSFTPSAFEKTFTPAPAPDLATSSS
jgi:hypothetical protein